MLSTEQIPDWAADPRTRAGRVAARFRERFASEPELWARAPGRVDLMGSHTDYNLGFVLTLPLSRDTWIAARRRDGRTVRVYSMNLDAEDEFRLDAIDRISGSTWCNYVRGVAATLQNEGFELTGCDAAIHGTVPLESGLSSSAALESAVATMFAGLGDWNLTAERKALLCQKAENEFVGVKCGILDQYSSCLGREGCALLLDCRDLSTRAVCIAAGIRIVVCNTMSRRRLSGSEYAQRRAECEQAAALLGVSALRDVTPEMLAAGRHELPERVARRAEFIVAESARAESLARALTAGRPAGRGPTLRGVVCGSQGPLRDLLAGDVGHDGRDARRAGSDRRAAGGRGIRRVHGRPGGCRAHRRLPRRRAGRLLRLDPGSCGDLPGRGRVGRGSIRHRGDWQMSAEPHRDGSFTRTTRSAITVLSCCTWPDGQRISIRSTDASAPSPKCIGPALDEA